MVIMGINIDEPPGKPLGKCKFKPVVITKYNGESDDNIRLENGYQGVTALRRLQLKRINDPDYRDKCDTYQKEIIFSNNYFGKTFAFL